MVSVFWCKHEKVKRTSHLGQTLLKGLCFGLAFYLPQLMLSLRADPKKLCLLWEIGCLQAGAVQNCHMEARIL